MSTRNISLPKELDQFVDAKVRSGEYAHASEVVREGLRLLMHHESAVLDRLREAIALGIADIDGGRTISSERAYDMVGEEGTALLTSRSTK